MKTDPICGMDVDETTALSATRAGVTAWFCCEGCRSAWLSGKEHAHGERVAPPPTAKYFCPMCEGVVSDVPGICPKCGMALEATGAGAEDDGELRDMTRRFWIGAVLTLPVFVLAMAHGQSWAMGSGWMQLALSTPVVFWAGWPFLVRGARSLRSRHLNMFTLISLGVAAAWIFSTASLFLRGPHADVYFEAAAMITVLALLGQVLELRATQPRADPGARGSRGRVVRARRAGGRGDHLRRVAHGRPFARAGEFRRRPHHRLSVRTRARHADGDHGRRRTRRARRRAHSECGRDRSFGKSDDHRRG